MKIGRRYKGKPKNIIMDFFIILLIISTSIVLIYLYNKNRVKENNLIKEIVEDNSKIEDNKKTERMLKLEKLQNAFPDVVAWLQIENSNINYPVMQTNDNSFYVTHNYKKENSKGGALFLDKDYNWDLPSTNFLIYGHNNIGSNEMFADLINYKDENYYNTHKTIRLTTKKEDTQYEIIAVFLSRVYYKSESNVFRYYYFINANNEIEFNEYVDNSKSASLYNIEATAKYGDDLLTLSTCEYSQVDGRLAVVARKVSK